MAWRLELLVLWFNIVFVYGLEVEVVHVAEGKASNVAPEVHAGHVCPDGHAMRILSSAVISWPITPTAPAFSREPCKSPCCPLPVALLLSCRTDSQAQQPPRSFSFKLHQVEARAPSLSECIKLNDSACQLCIGSPHILFSSAR